MTVLQPFNGEAIATHDSARAAVAALPSLRLAYRTLEPRMVFDAALVATALDAADHGVAAHANHADNLSTDDHSTLIDALHALPTVPPAETIVFVDARVQDYQRIVADLAPGARVVLLSGDTGGLEQIATYLTGHDNVDSIHILSHGASGELDLGGDVLTNANLSAHSAALTRIGQALRSGGDILIYGCNVASGAEGDKFISTVARLTGDDVAASTTLTGSAKRGGDWVLETHTGHIEATAIDAGNWDGTLAAFSINAASAPSVVPGAGGALTGTVVTYANVGTATVGGALVNINLVGTVTSSTAGDTIAWGAAGGAPNMVMGGGTDAGQVSVHWALVVSSAGPSLGLPFAGDIKIAVTDLDGAKPALIESVAASQSGLTSYAVGTPTNISVSATGGFIRADGTANESGGPTSIIQFSWTNVSTWDLTYYTASGQNGRQFNMMGSSAYVIPGAVTIGSLLDLDTNNSTTPGLNYQNTFVENGAGVTVVDSDVAITNLDGSALSPAATFSGATLVLTNAQLNDQLLVGLLPSNIAAAITSSAGTITVTLTGTDTAANYYAAMQAVLFKNTSDTPITIDRSLTVTVMNGAVASNPTISTIHITPVDDAPVTAVPPAQTTLEDTAVVFSSAKGNALTISDVDAGGTGLETVTLSVANGTLTLGSLTSLTGVTGNGTGVVKFTGTVAQVNAAMNGLTYLNTPDYNGTGPGSAGPDKLTISVTDDGKDSGVLASNGPQTSVVQTIDINITAVADITNDAVTVREDAILVFNAVTGTIGATADTFENATHPITSVTNGANGSVTFLANGQITYTPNPNFNGMDSFTYTVTSGGVTETATVTVTVTPVNDAPAGADTVRGIIEDTPYTLTAADFGFTDPNDSPADALKSVIITSLPLATDGVLKVGGVAVLAGQELTAAQLATLTFTPASNVNGNGLGTFTFQVRDTGGTANGGVDLDASPNTLKFNITPVNDAPASAVPGAQSVAEDTVLVFSGSNALTISDVDAGAGGLETVTLSVAHGTLTLGSTASIMGLAGDGTGTVTFTGTLAQVNAATAGLKYQGTLNYNGPDLLTIQVLDDGMDKGVLASNGALPAVIKTVAINVTPVNDPPVAVDDGYTTGEKITLLVPVATGLLGNDTDVDTAHTALVVNQINGAAATSGTAITLPSGAILTPNADGTFAYNPNGKFNTLAAGATATDTFTYQVSDGQGGVATASATITITGVNDAPAAVNDTYATGEKSVLTVPLATGLLANDTDADTAHTALVVSQINGNAMSPGAPITLASGAILTPNADGTFSYDPNGAYNSLAAGATATDSFTYQVSDGQGGFATATASVKVTGVNDAPVAKADFNSTNPDTAINVTAANGVLVNDTDPDTAHNLLSVTTISNGATSVAPGTIITGSNGGNFIVNANGSYSFDPAHAFDSLPPNSSATTSITYTVSDGKGGASTTTLTIQVPYVNLPPFVAQPLPAQSSLDGNAINISLAGVFSDPNPNDLGHLTITASGLPPGLSVDATGHIVGTLTADASQHAGPYQVTLTATDLAGSTITSTFTFNVGNPPPAATADVNAVTEHGTTTGAVLANDHDGGTDTDVLAVTQINGANFTPGSTITLPSGGQLVMTASGSYSYDPNGAFNGLGVGQTATDKFTYQVSDGQGGTANTTVTITINGQNDAPVIVDPSNPGTPPADPNNVIPAQTGADGTAITPLNVAGFFKDPDKTDTLTLSVIGTLPTGVTFDPVKGVFSGTPSSTASQGGPANNGVYTVMVVAKDGHGGVVSTAVTFTIGNPAPIANNDSNSVLEHATTTGNVVTNDHDGGGDTDPLSVTLVNGATLIPGSTITLPSGAQLVMAANGAYTYNPNGAFASLSTTQTATDTFTYQVSDGQGGIATATATIIIQGQNDAPVANPDAASTNPQVAITVTKAAGVLANDTDAEGDVLSVSAINGSSTNIGAAVTGTNGGVFKVAADGSYTFDPGHAFDSLAPGASASTSVSYTVSDGHGGTSTTTLTISVPYTNLPPVVMQPVPVQNSMDGNPVSIPVTGVFADPNPGDVVTISAAGLPPGLSYNPLSGAIEGTLAANASQHYGPWIVTLTATDVSGSTTTSTFNFNVGNPPPVAINDVNSVLEHGATTGDVITGSDHDGGTDSDPLTVTLVNGAGFTTGGTITLPSGALLVMNDNGTYSYDPNGAFNGLALNKTATDTFSYQISDGQGGVATAKVTITINGQNEAPIIVDPAHPGTPIDPNTVVPAQSGSDGALITPLSVKSFFADPDKTDTLTLSVDPLALPPGITFDPSTGTFKGTPSSGASQGGPLGNGVYNVVVTADDGNGGQVTTTVTFTIGNQAPVAAADSNAVAEHATTTGNVLTNDKDGGGDTDPLSVTQVNGSALPATGAIVLPSGALLTMDASGNYQYDPHGAFAYLKAGQTVADKFTYQISDGQGGFSTATVTVVITGENDNPVANADVNAVPEGASISVVAPLGVLRNDTDAEHDALTVSEVNGVATNVGLPITGSNGGSFVIQADGSYTFDTQHAFDGLLAGTKATTSVTYSISDGQGGTSSTTLTITVPFSDLPPVVNAPVPAQSSLDGSAVSINLKNVFKDPNPDDTLSIVASGLPDGLSYNSATGAIEGVIGPNASQHTGPWVVKLTATDNGGNTVSTTFNFTVSNPPPLAVDDKASVLEHGTTAGNVVTPNDHDSGGDADVLSVTLVNGFALPAVGTPIALPSGALLTMQANGDYTYNPNGAFDGLALNQKTTDSFTYQISDGQGGFSTATVAITITGQNDAPVVVDPANPGAPVGPTDQVVPVQPGNDGSAIVPLTVGQFFADPDANDKLSFTAATASLPPGITFDTTTGTFFGTLGPSASRGGPNHDGIYLVKVTATDLNGLKVTTIVTFDVSNPAPVAKDDANSVQEHGTASGNALTNDKDGGADADPLHVTQVNGVTIPAAGTITLPSGALITMASNGTYTYNPNGKFLNLAVGQTAVDSFTYQVSDGQGGFDTAIVSIVVKGQNDTPFVVDPATGLPPANPNAIIPAQSGSDGAPVTPIDVSSYFKDPDTGDVLALSVPAASLPPGVTFDPQTGTFGGAPLAGASQGGPLGNGIYPVVITANDGHGGTITTTVVFTIKNVPPVAVDDIGAANEHDTAAPGSVIANDHDGGGDKDPLSVTKVNSTAIVSGGTILLPSGAKLVMNSDGTYTYNPNGKFVNLGLGQTATDSFTYQITDGQGGFADATATITITGQNDSPLVVDPAHPGTLPADPNHIVPVQTAADGTPITDVSVAQLFKDPDGGDTLTLSIPSGVLPPGIRFDPATGIFSGTPTAGASQGGPLGNGVYNILVTASDGHGGVATTIVTFKIANPPPEAVNDVLVANEHDALVSGAVLANDHDGGLDTDPITVSQVNGKPLVSNATVTLPSGALLVMHSDGTYDYKPNGAFLKLAAGEIGADSFTYQITDGQGGFATAKVVITITGQNDAPVVIDPAHPGTPPADPNHVIPTVSGQDGTPIAPVNVAAVFDDPDTTDKLTFSVPAGSLPPGIVFNPVTGVFSGAPGANASPGGPNHDGVYPIKVTADDGHGGKVTTIVTFTFTNPPPVAADDTAFTEPDKPVVIAVLANDHDGGSDSDPLTVTSATTNSGTVAINPNGTLTFVPAPGFVGVATITYTISDGQGGTSTATARVLVTENIHVTAPAPIVPPSPDAVPPANIGLKADPAVVAAVNDAGSLNSLACDLNSQGIVVAVANQISGLGGIDRGGLTTREVHPLWRTGFATEDRDTRSSVLWQPEGLTGFSLRSTFAMDQTSGREAQVVIESLVRERTLILRLSSTDVRNQAHVVDYSVEMANGQALPAWLDHAGSRVLMGERPVDVERLELHISATLSDGTIIDRDVVIQTSTGEIQPLAEGKRSEIVPLFSDQLRQHAERLHRGGDQFGDLLRALAG